MLTQQQACFVVCSGLIVRRRPRPTPPPRSSMQCTPPCRTSYSERKTAVEISMIKHRHVPYRTRSLTYGTVQYSNTRYRVCCYCFVLVSIYRTVIFSVCMNTTFIMMHLTSLHHIMQGFKLLFYHKFFFDLGIYYCPRPCLTVFQLRSDWNPLSSSSIINHRRIIISQFGRLRRRVEVELLCTRCIISCVSFP